MHSKPDHLSDLPAIAHGGKPVTTPLRQRVAEVIKAWNAWRTAHVRADRVVDAGLFILLLASWTLGYVALCPPSENHRHVYFVAVQR